MELFIAAAIIAVLSLALVVYNENRTQKPPQVQAFLDKDIEAQSVELKVLRHQLREADKGNQLLHERISLVIKRIEHIEHYIGIRSHAFDKGERQWDFHQIAEDLHCPRPTRPRSMHNKQKSA